MATAPRRETMIALHARRTSHQVATAVYLHEHVRPLLQRCQSCGNEFAPTELAQDRCPQCAPKLGRYASGNAEEAQSQTPARPRIPALWKIHDALMSRTITAADALGVMLLFAIIAAFIGFSLWTIQAALVHSH